ncbi:MAG TPA: ABC transporter substrate-binding protein [Pseudolabrys sp.]|nr:ABC transporter substrate-binding protein [Pseudolabrys sp.]
MDMQRREFITLLGGAAIAWPLGARAQQAVKLYRIGILSPELPPPGFLEAFRQGLRELGYVEGQNIAFEVRSAEGYSQRLAPLANLLVELKVDVVLGINTPSVQAAKKASATIPIVMTRIADPVKSGLVPSLSRPGGNVTGLSFMVDELSGKQLALLKEAFPSVSRVAVLWYEANPGADIAVGAIKAASRELGLQLLLLPVHKPADLIAAFQAAARGRVEALIVVDDVVTTQHRVEILNLAATHSLAVVSQYRAFAEAGALLAYGPNTSAMYRRAAYYVDRILKGANAGDLPVEQPIKFDLVINLKTAKALGVTIPPSLLARADEVIE